MPFTVHQSYQANVLTIQGRFLGSIESEAVLQAVDEMIEAGQPHLIIDFSEADFMDSSGIGLLIRVAKRLREAGGDARLACLEDRIKNLFLMTRLLGSAFDDYPTVEAAAQSFTDAPRVAP